MNFPKYLPRVAPFAVYMLFVATSEIIALIPATSSLLSPESQTLLYPVKITCALATLFFFYRHCNEIRWRELSQLRQSSLSISLGIAVFGLWIYLTQPWAVLSIPQTSFTPQAVPEGVPRTALIAVRLAGAALVVPIIEELFWRSFLIRYLQKADFTSLPIGTISPLTFFGTALLFALEHHSVAAGFLAGLAYNTIYWRTRSIAQCILSHAVTNLLLGLYVIRYEQWWFW
ncbi:CAAX prenyl protease-related protein [Desulfovibrio mangrovi]|uniref:CAAX prenyl protease-related protein n=1 Tax=Desulfovibrio mangrovi TaxID=2976983 RepID=UPI002246A76F|nr:CAAX prenyl protease-related protein [Desulfovibrio mangrovi]UZP67536.1 CAAX prenyl protease-related protein [Desulfovibrio mangrovi]